MRIKRNFAKKEAGEEARLDLNQASHRDLISKKRMRRFLIEAPLVGGDERAPRIAAQVAAARGKNKILRRKLAIVERHEHGRIGENRPEGFDQIERQRRPARPLDMIEPFPGSILSIRQAAASKEEEANMTIRLEITCIVKADRKNPHERIQSVGGGGFLYALADSIRRIENGTNTFWTRGGGKTADVIVATHNGHKYLRTVNDGVQPDNLLVLPACK